MIYKKVTISIVKLDLKLEYWNLCDCVDEYILVKETIKNSGTILDAIGQKVDEIRYA